MRKFALAVAALGLAAAPAVASADRAFAPIEGESALGEQGIFLGAAALAVIVAVVVLVTDDDNEVPNDPLSP